MSDTETKVYNCYRAALRSLRHKAPGDRQSRVSERKQKALHIASERFQIRVGEVKAIVRAKDAENGITHDHPESYLKELALEQAYNNALETIGDEGPCQRCHATDEDESIWLRPNYKKYEANGEMEFARHCYLCFRDEFGGYPGF